MLIGVDHGNKQIKTVHCNPFVSGLKQSVTRPFGQNVLRYGDNDLDGVRNVKIAALIGQCHTAEVEQIVGFGIDTGREFSHG